MSQAAGGTTYTVVIQKSSPLLSLASVNGSTAIPQIGSNEGITFKMVVGAKLGKDKSGSYYPVTILAKSFQVPSSEYPMVGGGMSRQSTIMTKDAVGKLYPNGGAVDVSVVMGAKGPVATIGSDGQVGPAGSMVIPVSVTSNITLESTGKLFMSMPMNLVFTTGTSSLVVKGTKSRLEGKALPNDDTSNTLPKSLVGQPLDLNAETGKLVATSGIMGLKNKTLGTLDNVMGEVWVMKISK